MGVWRRVDRQRGGEAINPLCARGEIGPTAAQKCGSTVRFFRCCFERDLHFPLILFPFSFSFRA